MLYSLEIESEGRRKIVAIHESEKIIDEQMMLLVQESNPGIFKVAVPFDGFPVYVIEINNSDVANNTPEYVDMDGLMELIRNTMMVADDHYIHFTYYLFEDHYFFYNEAQTVMPSYVFSMNITDDFIKGFHENDSVQYLTGKRIVALVNNYDERGLDVLYHQYCKSGSTEQKEELASEGYIQFFYEMCYDFACNKLTLVDVDYFLPSIEKAEHLLQKKLWDLRGEAFSMLMENAVEHHPEQILSFAYQAIEAYRNQIIVNPDDQGKVYQRLAYLYKDLAEHDNEHIEANWQEALHYSKQSLEVNDNEHDWSFYMRLIYVPITTPPEVYTHQLTEQKKIITLIQSFDDDVEKSLLLALGYGQFKRYLDSFELDQTIFIQADYEYWLDKSTAWESSEAANMKRMDVASFYHREGKRLQKKNLLQASIRHYKIGVDRMEYSAFEIYYIAGALEDLSLIAKQEGNFIEENDYLQEAWSYYQDHYEQIVDNFSTLIHYCEFLERLYHHTSIHNKPTLEEIRIIALQAEEKGEGYYSSPGFLLMLLALDEDEEDEAIFHVIRLLILHELCIQDQIETLRQDERITGYKNLQQFLVDTIVFMAAARNNYYFDPAVKWNELKTMNAQEVDDYWRNRKKEILNRKPLA